MNKKKYLLAAAVAALALNASAQVAVSGAWARATVPQQKATGAFLRMDANAASRLIGVTSPAAARVEMHEMSMDGDVMKMREVSAIELPAGKTVELKPGAYHLMLMDLKKPITAGEAVPLTLTFEAKGGKRQVVEIKAEARALGK